MARIEVRVVKGGSGHIKLSGLTDLRTGEKVNNAQTVTGTVYSREADGTETALPGATGLVLTRAPADPAGQYLVGFPSTVANAIDVGTELRAYVLVVMPDARRMPFEGFGSVFPAGPSSP
jgi:hypothetical protein